MNEHQDGRSNAPVTENCTATENTEFTTDELFQALANRRRRWLIRTLADGSDEQRDLGNLARALAAVENDCAPAAVTSDQRKRVYIGLYQAHLKHLDDWGIIDWDSNRQTVEPGPTHAVALDALRAVCGPDSVESDESDTSHESDDQGWLACVWAVVSGGDAK